MIRTAELYKANSWSVGTRYYKYVPSNGVNPIGVILFYHGMGERSKTDLSLVERNGLPAYLAVDGVRAGVEIPYVVLCPQEEPTQEWWGRATECVRLAQTFNMPIHKCGLSLGSMIDAEIINTLGTDVFATVATCCGKINEFANTFTELGKIPTIHYYDPTDAVIQNGAGYTSVKTMHNKLKAAGKDSTMIEYTGVGHGVWSKAYNPTQPNNYLTWLESKLTPVPSPVEDEVVRTYYISGQLHFVTKSGLNLIR